MEVLLAKVKKGCIVCGAKVDAKNLCSVHYNRQRGHGNFDSLRPADWGQKDKHPLYERWKSMFRQGGRSEEWQDFWRYVGDVGEPPTDQRLYRLDDTQPWGPGNFEWRAAWTPADPAEKSTRNAYMKEWRLKNYGHVRNQKMMRDRGMTIAEYDALLEAQGGGCAICGELDPNFRLAIDHDHKTGRNRGLLCSNHNRALGWFKDDRTLLIRAVQYLDRHYTEDAEAA